MAGKNAKRITGKGQKNPRKKTATRGDHLVLSDGDESANMSLFGPVDEAAIPDLSEEARTSNQAVKTTTPSSIVLARRPAIPTNYIPSVMMNAPLYSGAELCEMVRALNDVIRQTAATVTDASFEYSEVEEGKRPNNTAKQFIKSSMFNRIYHAKGGLQKGLLQKGLEGVMVVACCEMLAAWSKDKTESEKLYNLYKHKIQQNGYWRAMTKKAVKLSLHENVENDLSKCLERVVKQILAIPGRWRDQLQPRIKQGIRDVCQAAMRLDVVLSEDPTDDDWEVFYALPDSKFDTETTEPIPDGEMSVSQGLVLCPTDLGLRRANFTNVSSVPSGSVKMEGTNPRVHWQIILKAKALVRG
ncbi:hypothetical protein E1B28_010450 [Marasmius oreades]|uniref:Uncharacterized protein n=1 Tax=Marasmius oreades TaxID=181124 RepID=A0A9P7URH7_9AGAR|nr:uncharacterized protein E1B28_010450 [Marasmius oreades]KAG7091413.1 hypothetical protein E1B28_010450 [Marasmius oreades]